MDLAHFTNYRKHITQTITDTGQWVGLCDENGWPITDLPPAVNLTAPETHLTAESIELTVPVSPGDKLMAELADVELGQMDASGQMDVSTGPARVIVVAREGEMRRAYRVVSAKLTGQTAPTQMTISGVDYLAQLAWWPAPSVPATWIGPFKSWDTDASGTTYNTPRQVTQVRFATTADGHTMSGPAAPTIAKVCAVSAAQVHHLMGWDTTSMAVINPANQAGDELLIRITDDPLLDTISGPALSAGISVRVGLWWPGDPAPQVIELTNADPTTGEMTFTTRTATWAAPVLLITVEQITEQPV